MTTMTKGAITNLVNRYKAVLKKCRLINLFGSLAVAGMLVMGGAGMADAASLTAAFMNSSTESIDYTGAVDIGVYSAGATLDFSGETLSLSTTPGSGWGNGNVGLWATSSATTRSIINFGEAGKTKLINIDVRETSDTTNYPAVIWARGDENKLGGVVNLNADEVVLTGYSKTGSIYGLYAQNATTTSDKDLATININAGKTYIDLTTGNEHEACAIVAMSQGRINIEGDLYVNTRGGTGSAVVARGDAAVIINKSGTNTVQMNGNLDFNFHDESSGTKVDALVDVTLSGADSWWNGNASITYGENQKPSDDKLSVSGMSLAINDGATWTPTAIATIAGDDAGTMQAALNYLNMDNGIVNLNPDVNIQVDNLTGTGTVNLAVSADAPQQAGTLTAATATGSALDVNLTGVTSDDLTVEQAASLLQGVSSTDGQLAVTGNVDEGLVNDGLTFNPDGTVTRHGNRMMAAALEQAAISTVTIDRILTNDLRRRMGDLRSANGEHGLWFRWDGGRLKGGSSLTNDFHTAQLGADTAVGDNVRLGLAASFTYGDVEYSRGTSDMEGLALAGYGVWMAENGLYTDIVGRIGTFSTDMKVQGNKGTVDNFVASLSGEVGWRFNLSKQFYVEPQLELAYTYIDGDRFGLGPARYDIDDTDSLIGRAGIAVGFKLPDDRGDVYARASVVQQFMGDAKISGYINDMTNIYKLDGEDTWLEYGIGTNVRLTDAIYAWADVERTEGAYIDEEWRGTVGLRYSF